METKYGNQMAPKELFAELFGFGTPSYLSLVSFVSLESLDGSFGLAVSFAFAPLL